MDEHLVDRFHKDAARAAYAGAVERTKGRRQLVAEQLDRFKWVAAFSTAAFFFVVKSLADRTGPVRVETVRGPLAAEFLFLLSLLGAGVYMFLVDRRVSQWFTSSDVVYERG